MLHRAHIRRLEADDENPSIVNEVVIPVAIGAMLGIVIGLAVIALFLLRLRIIGFPGL